MKKLLTLVLFAILMSSVGCARLTDKWSAKGGIIGSTRAPYIVISQSGGEIMDVFKLPKAIVQSSSESDGWLFKSKDGNPIFVGGDVKTIRLSNTKDDRWADYHEYHMEFESLSYREKFNSPSTPGFVD
jgi:hypothetical protein